MVVQVTLLNELAGPVVEAVDAGLAFPGRLDLAAQLRIKTQPSQPVVYLVTVVSPDGGAQLQPAFPVAASAYLLNELARCRWAMLPKHGCQNRFLRNESVSDPGGEQ